MAQGNDTTREPVEVEVFDAETKELIIGTIHMTHEQLSEEDHDQMIDKLLDALDGHPAGLAVGALGDLTSRLVSSYYQSVRIDNLVSGEEVPGERSGLNDRLRELTKLLGDARTIALRHGPGITFALAFYLVLAEAQSIFQSIPNYQEAENDDADSDGS